MNEQLRRKLQQRERLGNLRNLSMKSELIDFSSNDTLGLARSSELVKATAKELSSHASTLNGMGSTGSRLLTGNSWYAEELEQSIATFHGYEAGLLFTCGYMANIGLISSIATNEDNIIFDANVHASTCDGIRLSKAKAYPFRHNDLEHLENRLKHYAKDAVCYVCIESIYSTDGSQAPLVEICKLTQKYNAYLIVDEAHAVGIYGPQGKGLVAQYNLMSQIFAQITTFGKAVGTHGAIVLGSTLLKHTLINFATSFIYTTALPLHSLAAIKASYSLFPTMDSERNNLQKLIHQLSSTVPQSSHSQIHAIPFPGNQNVKRAEDTLQLNGFNVRALKSPTVRKNYEVLRICLHSFNTDEEVKTLITLLQTMRGNRYV